MTVTRSLREMDPAVIYASSNFFDSPERQRELYDKAERAIDKTFPEEMFERRHGILCHITRGGEASWIQQSRGYVTSADPYIFNPKPGYEQEGVFHLLEAVPDLKDDDPRNGANFKVIISRFQGNPQLRDNIEKRIRKAFEREGFREKED